MSGFETDRRRLDDEFDAVLAEVYPDELRSYVGRELEASSRTPALLCLLAGRATEGEYSVEDAAGIQFIHAGLAATRRVLDNAEAWKGAGFEPVEEDMVLLAADVLVTVGFDYLLDDYRAATRVVNRFGEETARGREATDGDELEHEIETFVETYTTAVEIGVGGEPPEELVSLGESLAFADCLGRKGGDVSEHAERADSLADNFDAHEAHVEAIRDASAVHGVGSETGD